MDEDVLKYTIMYMVEMAKNDSGYKLDFEIDKLKKSDFLKELDVSLSLVDEYKKYYIEKGGAVFE